MSTDRTKVLVSKFYNSGNLSKRIEEKSMFAEDKKWVAKAIATLEDWYLLKKDVLKGPVDPERKQAIEKAVIVC